MAKKRTWIVTTQAEIAEFFGTAVGTVRVWGGQGMPGKTGAYDLSKIVQWLRNDGPWQRYAKVESDDPLLASDGDSPGLERYRLAKAALAELELEERTGSLLSREKARSVLLRWAAVIRRLGERLGKRYGPDATIAVNDAVSECQHVIDYELGCSQSANGCPAQ